MFKKLYTYSLVFLFFMTLLYACSSSSSYRMRSFFFDGVPNPADQLQVVLDSTTILDSLGNATVIVKPDMYVHPPYENRGCNNCHDIQNISKPKLPVPQLCFECHEKPADKFSFLHGPVDAGQCTQCHHPHRSKNDFLLRLVDNDLCLNCHMEAKVLDNPIHEAIGDTNCTQCHNPHGGNDRFVLQKDACFNCHDTAIVDNEFVHGPVAANQCNLCHDNHESQADKLLKFQGDALCLQCHVRADVLTTAAHKTEAAKTTDCTQCHNPHSSESKYLTLTSETP
ncbi:MAG: hypothetical protein KAJ23_15925 [Maribacter sp.]|nr:hypothetical protein [Maribacter sp.]